MGLFDFLKGTGHKVFSNEEEANHKIEEHILANNPGINNLKVSYKNSVAHLSGEAQTPEAVQKAVLMAGNIQGVQSVDVSGIKFSSHIQTIQTPTAVENYQGTQYYIIQSGDTLSKIALRFYGSADKFSVIFDANREVIRDPNLIFPGQKILIPAEKHKAA